MEIYSHNSQELLIRLQVIFIPSSHSGWSFYKWFIAEMLNHRSRVRGNKAVKVYLGSFQLTQLLFFVKCPSRRGACASVGSAWAQFWRWLRCYRNLFLPHPSAVHTQIIRSQNVLLAPLGRSAWGEGQPSHRPCPREHHGSKGWRPGRWCSFILGSVHPTLFSTTHGQRPQGLAPHIFHTAER